MGPAMMPRLTHRTANKIKAVEFGTGAYGTVIPTKTKGWVVKVTSDESEARFAAIAMSIGRFPPGMVKYKAAFHVSGTHSGRPIYILWRQEANQVGKAVHGRTKELLKDYYESAETSFWYVADHGRSAISALRSKSKPGLLKRWLSPAAKASAAFQDARVVAGKLSRTRDGASLGKAILFYLDRGILLSDLHTGNVGIVGNHVVITDPGHMLLLNDRYRGVKPRELLGQSSRPRRRSAA
jgi:hypothetical protein